MIRFLIPAKPGAEKRACGPSFFKGSDTLNRTHHECRARSSEPDPVDMGDMVDLIEEQRGQFGELPILRVAVVPQGMHHLRLEPAEVLPRPSTCPQTKNT